MDKKKLFKVILGAIIVAFLMILMGFPNISADFGVDNYQKFDGGVGDYGKINIYDRGLVPFVIEEDTLLAEYTLDYNTDQCLINCEARGTAILYTKGKLFSDMGFYGKDTKKRNLNYDIFILIENEEYKKQIPKYQETCISISSNNSLNCKTTLTSYETKKYYRTYWKKYSGEKLDPGTYQWKLEGKKQIKESVDWIGKSFGEKFDNWAWWNSNWNYRRQLNITGGQEHLTNFTFLVNVSHVENMSATLDDVRFINGSCGGAQTEELDYEKTEVRASNSAHFWVRLLEANTGDNTICMYFNNSGATDTSTSDAWDDYYKAVYHFNGTADSKGLHNLTIDSGDPEIISAGGECSIGQCAKFDGNDAYNTSDHADWDITGPFAFSGYLNVSQNSGFKSIMSQWEDATHKWTFAQEAGKIVGTIFNGGGSDAKTTETIGSNLSYFASWVRNLSTFYVSLNNSNMTQESTIIGYNTSNPSLIKIGKEGSTSYWVGQIDELYYSNTTRSNAWMNRTRDNYNFNLVTFGPIGRNTPSVDLSSPNDGANFTTQSVTLECNASYSPGLKNLSIFLDGVINHTETTTGQSINLSTAMQVSIATHNWSCLGYGDDGQSTMTSNRTFTIEEYQYYQATNKSRAGEGEEIYFLLQINVTGIKSTNANLLWNNTLYAPDTIQSSAQFFNFSKTLTVPDHSGNSTGATVAWQWHFNITGGSNVSTNWNNQTIHSAEIDNCTIFTQEILNISLNDEETDTRISPTNENTTIELDIDLISRSDSALSWNYSNEWTNETDVRICVPTGLLNNDTEYEMDFDIYYKSDDYAEEYYFADNLSVTNTTVPQYVTLRDLLLVDSTSFVISYEDENRIAVADAIIYVLRKYIGEGIFKEVEGVKTNNDGEAISHLVEEDVIYQFNVTIGGRQSFLSDEYKVYCASTTDVCTLELSKGTSVSDFPDQWDRLPEGTYHLSTDKTTRVVTLTFSMDRSHEMNMTVFKYSNNQSEMDKAVGSNSTNRSAGSITIFVARTYDNSTYHAKLYKDGNWFASEWVDLTESAADYIGTTISLFFTGLMVLAMGLMAISSGVGVILFALVGLILAVGLQLLDIGYAILMYAICAGLIIIIKIQMRRRHR